MGKTWVPSLAIKPLARSVPNIQKAPDNCLLEAGEIAQSVKHLQKCLLCKHEDVSSIPSLSQYWGGRDRSSLGLTGQQLSPFSDTQANESPCLQTHSVTVPQEEYPELASDLCTNTWPHTCICNCLHTHRRAICHTCRSCVTSGKCLDLWASCLNYEDGQPFYLIGLIKSTDGCA